VIIHLERWGQGKPHVITSAYGAALGAGAGGRTCKRLLERHVRVHGVQRRDEAELFFNLLFV
jgi:hypothetical protein